MSAICYRCQRFLPDYWIIRRGVTPDDAWHMVNVSPNAASGGVMKPVCHKCDPGPLIAQPGYTQYTGYRP
jgi:hypothetical protein